MGDVTVAASPGAAALYKSGVFAFVRGSDANLWSSFSIDRAPFQWAKLGGPIAEVVGVVCLGPSMFVFCLGTEGQLLAHWWDGEAWHAAELGMPSVGRIERGVGVTSNGSMIYVFVKAAGELCMCWWSGSQWQWHNQGQPAPNAPVLYGCGAIASDKFVWVFVTGWDMQLWVRMWTGVGWQWSNLGQPPGRQVNNQPVGCTLFNNYPVAYVIADDDHVWSCAWDGSRWFWTDQEAPESGACGRVGVVNYRGWPLVFVMSRQGDMWVNNAHNGRWSWQKQGHTGTADGIGATSLIIYHHHDVGDDVGMIIGGAILAAASLVARENRVDQGTGNKGISAGVDLMVKGINDAQKSGTTEEFPFAFALGREGTLKVSWYHDSGWQWSDIGKPEG